MHKYIIMGPQGSGKGTQAKMLCKHLGAIHISVGDLFRWHVENKTKLAARIKRIMDSGRLVPDEIVDEVVKNRLDLHDWNFGFILDGFPRNAPQAEFFLESYDIDAVIYLDVAEEIVMQRVLSRRACEVCGLDYNLMFHRPEVADTCDVCKGHLAVRSDDNPEAVRSRLRSFNEKTQPIVDLFRRKELVVVADAAAPPDDVQATIRERLGIEKPNPLEVVR